MAVVGACTRCGAAVEAGDLPRGSGLIRCPECGAVLGDKCGC